MEDELDENPGRISGPSPISVESGGKIGRSEVTNVNPKKNEFHNQKELSVTRKDRISSATKEKGLKQLPQNFGDSDGDWQIIESDNLFEILYTDYNQIISINPEIIKNNFTIIEKFWKEKKNLWESGSGQVRNTIEDKYGAKNLNNCIKKLENSYEHLSSIQKISDYYQKFVEQRIAIGQNRLEPLFKMMFKDEVAEPGEMENIFEEGLKLDFSDEEISIIIKKVLDARNYVPYGNPTGDCLKEQLLSILWMTERKIKEKEIEDKDPRNKGKEIFENKFAKSIEEIGTILFEDEGQAQEYIKEELIIEPINSFSVPKAKRIKEIIKAEKLSEHLKYLNIVYFLNPKLPYRFQKKEYYDLKTLSVAFFEEQKQSKEHFKQGNIEIWLKECQPENYIKLIKIRDTAPNIDLAYLELLYTFNSELPYSFNNINYSNLNDLCLAFFENPEMGKENLQQGNIEIWLKECQPENYVKLIKIRDTAANVDLAFLELLYTFNPKLPYRFSSTLLVKTPLELCNEINKSKENWTAGKEELYNSSILIWLKTIGKLSIFDKWEKVKDQYLERKDVGLENFLHLLNEKIEYPLLEISEKAFTFPSIQSGDKVVAGFILNNKTRGFIDGNLAFSKILDGVTLSSKKFSLNSASGVSNLKVNLTIDSNKLLKGVDYQTDIQITTSDNKMTSIPVSFKLVFPRSAFIKEIIKYALLFALIGGIVRGGWLFFGFKDWLKVNYQYYLLRTDVYWQDKPAIFYFPFIFLILIAFIILIIWNWKKVTRLMDKI